MLECDEARYEALLQAKVERVSDLVLSAAAVEQQAKEEEEEDIRVAVHDSPKSHFRQRANFRVVIEEDEVRYVMFSASDPSTPLRVESFPRGSRRLNELMATTAGEMPTQLRDNLIEVRFQTTMAKNGGCLVLLCYRRAIDEAAWRPAAETLRRRLGKSDSIVVGRSKGLQVVVGADRACITETFRVAGRTLNYEQVEGEFSQPNAHVCQKMLQWAFEMTSSAPLGCEEKDQDLLELYCGNGNFSIALAPNFRRVLATEMSKTNVACAKGNVARNSLIETVKVAKLTSAEMGVAMSPNGREFNRLRDAHIDLKQYDFRAVLVDPPRAGLDKDTVALVSTFQNILYISCNPLTLARDLKILKATHRLTNLAVFDQFAYTDHVESGVFLVKRDVPLALTAIGEEEEEGEEFGKKKKARAKRVRSKRKQRDFLDTDERPSPIADVAATGSKAKRQRLGCCLM